MYIIVSAASFGLLHFLKIILKLLFPICFYIARFNIFLIFFIRILLDHITYKEMLVYKIFIEIFKVCRKLKY